MRVNADATKPDRPERRPTPDEELDRALGACLGRRLWVGLHGALPRRAARLAFDAAAARALRS